jgi:hypothetical protein
MLFLLNVSCNRHSHADKRDVHSLLKKAMTRIVNNDYRRFFVLADLSRSKIRNLTQIEIIQSLGEAMSWLVGAFLLLN